MKTRVILLAAAAGLLFLGPSMLSISAAGDSLVGGYSVTSGAAPGYVPDLLCGSCHTDLYQSYQKVSMAKAFYRPRPDRVIEDFESASFFHDKSQRHYEMTMGGDDTYVLRRFQVDDRGRSINVFERKVDWILGSGSHARVYLYQTEKGELYQLPIAWYGQTSSWGMAPGYDRVEHQGVTRLVRRECMFCHNAYPDVAAGSDAYDADHIFPFELPEGLGCQRCHGPGAEHARIAMDFPVDFGRLAAAIVDPGKLSPRQRTGLCYGCHMQPAVAVDSVRRFGRGDYSFRPGEELGDYMVQVDVEEKGKKREDRFEINHHPYRLEQSRCFQRSEGALSCLTCHDPHRQIEPAERAAHYRAACVTCHELDDCALDDMQVGDDAPFGVGNLSALESGDCVGCHMAKRRPQDAVQVVMTDHLIRRHPPATGELDEFGEPKEEVSVPSIVDITLLDGATPHGELYRATAAVRASSGELASEWLRETLDSDPIAELDPHLDLARAQVEQQRPAAALLTLQKILAKEPHHPWALEWKAIAKSRQGETAEALATLREVVSRYPRSPQGRFNLGRLLTGVGRPKEAVVELEHALRLRPPMASAHLHLGHAFADLGRFEDAARSYWAALEVEPSSTAAWLALARLLQEKGDHQGEARILRLAPRLSARPEQLREANSIVETKRSRVSELATAKPSG